LGNFLFFTLIFVIPEGFTTMVANEGSLEKARAGCFKQVTQDQWLNVPCEGHKGNLFGWG